MNTEALLQLIRVMEEVRDTPILAENFNLGNWYAGSAANFSFLKKGDFKVKAATSGTICCAAGYAGLDTWFRERGFIGRSWSISFFISNKPEYYGIDAIRAFFEITYEDSSTIFYPHGYKKPVSEITPEDVIININKVIKNL